MNCDFRVHIILCVIRVHNYWMLVKGLDEMLDDTSADLLYDWKEYNNNNMSNSMGTGSHGDVICMHPCLYVCNKFVLF